MKMNNDSGGQHCFSKSDDQTADDFYVPKRTCTSRGIQYIDAETENGPPSSQFDVVSQNQTHYSDVISNLTESVSEKSKSNTSMVLPQDIKRNCVKRKNARLVNHSLPSPRSKTLRSYKNMPPPILNGNMNNLSLSTHSVTSESSVFDKDIAESSEVLSRGYKSRGKNLNMKIDKCSNYVNTAFNRSMISSRKSSNFIDTNGQPNIKNTSAKCLNSLGTRDNNVACHSGKFRMGASKQLFRSSNNTRISHNENTSFEHSDLFETRDGNEFSDCSGEIRTLRRSSRSANSADMNHDGEGASLEHFSLEERHINDNIDSDCNMSLRTLGKPTRTTNNVNIHYNHESRSCENLNSLEAGNDNDMVHCDDTTIRYPSRFHRRNPVQCENNSGDANSSVLDENDDEVNVLFSKIQNGPVDHEQCYTEAGTSATNNDNFHSADHFENRSELDSSVVLGGSSEDEITVLYANNKRLRICDKRGNHSRAVRENNDSTDVNVEVVTLSPDPTDKQTQIVEDEKYARMLQDAYDAEVDAREVRLLRSIREKQDDKQTSCEEISSCSAANDVSCTAINDISCSASNDISCSASNDFQLPSHSGNPDTSYYSETIRSDTEMQMPPHSVPNDVHLAPQSVHVQTPTHFLIYSGNSQQHDDSFNIITQSISQRPAVTVRSRINRRRGHTSRITLPESQFYARIVIRGLRGNHGFVRFLEEEDAGPVGLEESDINRLPVHEFTSDSTSPSAFESVSEKCLICLCNYENGDLLRRLPCFHEFHTFCIGPWLQQKPTCPVCRLVISINNLPNSSPE